MRYSDAGGVVRCKTGRNKLDVAPIRRDREITQRLDERSRPIHGIEAKPERRNGSSKDRTR